MCKIPGNLSIGSHKLLQRVSVTPAGLEAKLSLCKGPGAGRAWCDGGTVRRPMWLEQREQSGGAHGGGGRSCRALQDAGGLGL
jgi:hypothetical protein